MRYIIFGCFTWLLLGACQGNYKMVKKTNAEGQLIEQYTIDRKAGYKEGAYKSFFSDGQVFEESNYRKDTLDGERKLYYEDGTLQIVERYIAGNFEGVYQSFYGNGQLEMEGLYENNAMTGIWKRYYKTGELMEEVTFSDNLENGPFAEYYQNGNKKAEGNYLDGDNEHGELLLYDEKGELVKKMDCKRGVCRTSWEKE